MTYSSDIECSNCGYSGSLDIPEGLKIGEMPCPECRSKSLIPVKKKEPEKPESTSPEM